MINTTIFLWSMLFIVIVLFGFTMIFILSWNIPVTLLRFTGNKGRPMLIHKKARKVIKHGIPRLYVRGYKDPIRDYLAENYYPTGRGKYGGLILWEFEDGLLTPALPKKEVKKLSEEQKKQYEEAKKYFTAKSVSFEFDEQLYKDLKLKVVDDVDQEFMLQEQYRLDDQYKGGWKDFIMKYGSHLALIIIATLLLVGVIQWFEKSPEMMAACANAAKGIVEQTLIDRAAELAKPVA